MERFGKNLRKNRTLRRLQLDGQNASYLGWKAFRGCLYGNKKLIDLSYPWMDMRNYFEFISTSVEQGMKRAAAVKLEIQMAHKQRNLALKRSKIEAIKQVKRGYKPLERQQLSVLVTLADVFGSVEENNTIYNDFIFQKNMLVKNSPQSIAFREKIVTKEISYISKLQKELSKLLSTLHIPGGRNIDPASNPIWNEIFSIISMGSKLFVKHNFNRLAALLHTCGAYMSQKVVNMLDSIAELILLIQGKVSLWNITPMQFAEEIWDIYVSRRNEIELSANDIRQAKLAHDQSDESDGYGGVVAIHDYENAIVYGEWGSNTRASKESNNESSQGDDMETPAAPRPPHFLYTLADNKEDVTKKTQGKRQADSSHFIESLKKTWKEVMFTTLSKNVNSIVKPLDYEYELAHTVIDFEDSRSKSSQFSCCLVTQCSVDRLFKLESIVKYWDGAVSAAVYIPTYKKQKEEAMKRLQTFIAHMMDIANSDNSYHGRLTISILYGHENQPWNWDEVEAGTSSNGPMYPINNLRNLAVTANNKKGSCSSASDLLFLLDVDFLPSKGLRQWIDAHKDHIVNRCHSNDQVFVVPAFETSVCNAENFDDSLLEYSGIQKSFDEGKTSVFHVKHFPRGHQATDYDR